MTPEYLKIKAISIGQNTWMQKIAAHSTGEWVGIIEWHLNQAGELCGGFVAFAGFYGMTSHGMSPVERPVWQVATLEPLTLSPSISCKACGHHGYIRAGRWVPA